MIMAIALDISDSKCSFCDKLRYFCDNYNKKAQLKIQLGFVS